MGIANIINNSTTTSGGEIVRELVNSSDGQGLHFDGTDGFIDIASPPDLGSKFSFEFIFKASTWTSGAYKFLVDFEGSGDNRFIIGTNNSGNNLRVFDGAAYQDTGVIIFDDLAVHHVVVTVDGTAAVVYDNGNQVGSATISASHGLDNATDARIGSNSAGANRINGTMYRCRFYNKTLSSAEVQTAADVDFADQYGRQAITDGNFPNADNWTEGTGWNIASNKANFTTGQTSALSQTGVFTSADVGKTVRINFEIETATASIFIGNAAGGTSYLGTGYVAYAVGTNTVEFTMPSETTLGFWSSGATFSLKNVSVHVEGCVSDYDLAFANPTQSLIVRDRSGTADATCSASGMSQVQKIRQLNAEKLFLSDIPTSNPGGSNQVWNDSGTLKIT